MIIHLCIKFQSNISILSKDITQKPKVLRMGRTDGTDIRTDSGNTIWKPFFKVEIFSKLKRAITPKIIGGFYPKSNFAYIYDYTPVYKISIQYINPFKRYHTETKSVTYGTDGRTYGQR